MTGCLSEKRRQLIGLDFVVSRKAAFALASQAIASLSNFTTTIVAARALTEVRQFSIFVLTFSLVFLADNVQTALVFKPMAIFGAALTGKDASRHFSTCLLHEAALVLCLLLVCLAACMCTGVLGPWSCAGLLLFMLQQYFRFLFFTKTRTEAVLLLDVLGHGVRILLLLAACAWARLDFDDIFILLAIPAALATLCGLLLCRNMLVPVSPRRALAAFREFFKVSKWILSYNLVVWLNANVFFFLVAALIGISAPAILKACINLLGPLNIFSMGIANLALPIASRRLLGGEQAAFTALVKSVLRLFGATAAVYGILVLVKLDLLFSVFYGRSNPYARYAALVPLFVVQHLFAAVNQSYVIGLEAMRETRKIFVAYLAGTAFSLVVTLSLAGNLSLYGIAACWCLSSALVTFLNRRFYKSRVAELARA